MVWKSIKSSKPSFFSHDKRTRNLYQIYKDVWFEHLLWMSFEIVTRIGM